MEEVLGVLRGDTSRYTNVAIAGSMARTRYSDLDMVFAVLEIMRDAKPFYLIHGGVMPFDMYVHRMAGYLGLNDCLIGPSYEKRLTREYKRPLEILDGACMLLVFPRDRHVPGEELKDVVSFAYELGTPVASVDREGDVRLTRKKECNS